MLNAVGLSGCEQRGQGCEDEVRQHPGGACLGLRSWEPIDHDVAVLIVFTGEQQAFKGAASEVVSDEFGGGCE